MPWIIAHLLDTQRNAVLLLVKLQDLGFDFIAHSQHFGWVLHATPCQVGDVQQAIDTAQVNECAVVGDVLDHALDDRAFLEVFHDRFTIGTHARFQHRAARNHHVVALAIQLDDLQFHGLVFVRRGVLDRTDIHQRTRQERADTVDHRSQAALDFAADKAFDDLAFFHGNFQSRAMQPDAWLFRATAWFRHSRFPATRSRR